MTKRHRSILESREIAIDCVFWLIVFLLAALAMQLLSFPSSNGDRQAIVSDTFDTPIAAGEVGGTYSTGGQLRAATDAESKASVADGKLSISGGKDTPAAGDPGVWWPAVTRANGLTLRGTINQAATTKIASFGWDADTGGAVSAGFSTAASAVLNFTDSAARKIGAYAAATDYPMTIQAGVSKWFAYLNESGIWKLKYVSFLNVSDTTIYPAISGNTAALTLDNLDVRIRPLPVPLASDSFDRANGALGSTDGTGHAEMNGGANVAWTVSNAAVKIVGNAINNTAITNHIAYLQLATPNVLAMHNAYQTNVGTAALYLRHNGIVQGESGCNGIWMRVLTNGAWVIRKYVNNVTTDSASGTTTYSNGARIMGILDGTEARLYYNNAYLGTATIDEPTINNSRLHGLGLPTSGVANRCAADDLSIWARGNEGQYSYMGDRR